VDAGGFIADWSMPIFCRYQPYMWIYEPGKEYTEMCRAMFSGNKKVTIVESGLSDKNKTLKFNGNGGTGSVYYNKISKVSEITTVKASEEFAKFKIIDLLKLNIEGSEYDVMPDLICNYGMERIKNLLISFHYNVPKWETNRDVIVDALKHTHKKDWGYGDYWQSWSLK
jgi:FkbM family methyltransferase